MRLPTASRMMRRIDAAMKDDAKLMAAIADMVPNRLQDQQEQLPRR